MLLHPDLWSVRCRMGRNHVWRVLPFEWNESPFAYHTMAREPTFFVRWKDWPRRTLMMSGCVTRGPCIIPRLLFVGCFGHDDDTNLYCRHCGVAAAQLTPTPRPAGKMPLNTDEPRLDPRLSAFHARHAVRLDRRGRVRLRVRLRKRLTDFRGSIPRCARTGSSKPGPDPRAVVLPRFSGETDLRMPRNFKRSGVIHCRGQITPEDARGDVRRASWICSLIQN